MTDRSTRRTKEEVLEEYRCSTIEDAAIAVIARKGVEHATIQEIADEAGIAKGTVYVYFKDREALLSRVADRAFTRLCDELAQVFDAPGTFAQRLEALVVKQISFFDENADLFRATMALSRREAEAPRKHWPASYTRYSALLESMFQTARESGEIRGDLEPAAVVGVYRDCLRGVLIRRIEHKSRTPRADDAHLIVSVLLRGILS
jgi:AcrR family transcriptional regulator